MPDVESASSEASTAQISPLAKGRSGFSCNRLLSCRRHRSSQLACCCGLV